MDDFVIDNDVPIPKRHKSTGLTSALATMEVGESLFIAGKKTAFAGSYTARLKPKKFTSRTEKNGVRIWRTA